MSSTRTRRPIAVGLLFGGIAALACACSSGTGSTPGASASPHPAVSASPSPTGPGAAALAAYRAMWVELVEANQTSNYRASYLPDHLAGQALLTVTDNMAAEKAQGVIVLGQPVLHPVVVSASASEVRIQDCDQEEGWLEYFASTHKLVDNTPGGDRSTTATVTDENGTWKVTQINSGADGTCHVTP